MSLVNGVATRDQIFMLGCEPMFMRVFCANPSIIFVNLTDSILVFNF